MAFKPTNPMYTSSSSSDHVCKIVHTSQVDNNEPPPLHSFAYWIKSPTFCLVGLPKRALFSLIITRAAAQPEGPKKSLAGKETLPSFFQKKKNGVTRTRGQT